MHKTFFMSHPLIAEFENREYHFKISSLKPTEVKIDMYNTEYIFIKGESGFTNSPQNRFNMTQGLINAVVAKINE